ncbi:hypothetical protein B0H17DRAFT_1151504 [Mycena rosella]|uniref:Uncharacterized protein n=1 Tax=Mycena rosella TaxID=1033263 RepID=A0AAD7BJB7_MYCRO|nr:hypothetical protein B0H17DRAFT_1151504 [Mycena rosella]
MEESVDLIRGYTAIESETPIVPSSAIRTFERRHADSLHRCFPGGGVGGRIIKVHDRSIRLTPAQCFIACAGKAQPNNTTAEREAENHKIEEAFGDDYGELNRGQVDTYQGVALGLRSLASISASTTTATAGMWAKALPYSEYYPDFRLVWRLVSVEINGWWGGVSLNLRYRYISVLGRQVIGIVVIREPEGSSMLRMGKMKTVLVCLRIIAGGQWRGEAVRSSYPTPDILHQSPSDVQDPIERLAAPTDPLDLKESHIVGTSTCRRIIVSARETTRIQYLSQILVVHHQRIRPSENSVIMHGTSAQMVVFSSPLSPTIILFQQRTEGSREILGLISSRGSDAAQLRIKPITRSGARELGQIITRDFHFATCSSGGKHI